MVQPGGVLAAVCAGPLDEREERGPVAVAESAADRPVVTPPSEAARATAHRARGPAQADHVGIERERPVEIGDAVRPRRGESNREAESSIVAA